MILGLLRRGCDKKVEGTPLGHDTRTNTYLLGQQKFHSGRPHHNALFNQISCFNFNVGHPRKSQSIKVK